MKPPQIPPDEEQRLDALRALSLLDSTPEECFDRPTRLARRLFAVPIALISLVDTDRQWFKAKVGLNASETHRDISFCGHAILGDRPLIVRDATQDEYFADNPLVTGEPGIRFYAGCPIRSPNGYKLGTLCVIDRRAREFTPEDEAALIDLAAMVEREIAAIQLATTDELTGIPNRRGFTTLAEQSLSLCRREGLPVSLIFMDVDQLKPVNDRFGHHEGDRLLKSFASHMRKTFRNSDVIARVGGDEFAVLLADMKLSDATGVVTRFQQAIDTLNQDAERLYSVAFSHGMVEFVPDRHRCLEDLLTEGDARMYRVKREKRSA